MDDREKAIRLEAGQAVGMVAAYYYGGADKKKISKDTFKRALNEMYLWARACQLFIDRNGIKKCVELDFTTDETLGEIEMDFDAMWRVFYNTDAGRSSFKPCTVDDLQHVNTVNDFYLQTVRGARLAKKKD